MYIIIGLGNPGKKYQNTRHNAGHQAIDRLGDLPQTRLFKTDTYMNESGIFVQKTVNFYKINPDHLYIIHDDLDLAVGEWRLQFDRGPAGHHGVESVVQHLNTQAFWRLRIGIGHPRSAVAEGKGDLADSTPVEDYVLRPFPPDEKIIINKTLDQIADKIKITLSA